MDCGRVNSHVASFLFTVCCFTRWWPNKLWLLCVWRRLFDALSRVWFFSAQYRLSAATSPNNWTYVLHVCYQEERFFFHGRNILKWFWRYFKHVFTLFSVFSLALWRLWGCKQQLSLCILWTRCYMLIDCVRWCREDHLLLYKNSLNYLQWHCSLLFTACQIVWPAECFMVSYTSVVQPELLKNELLCLFLL